MNSFQEKRICQVTICIISTEFLWIDIKRRLCPHSEGSWVEILSESNSDSFIQFHRVRGWNHFCREWELFLSSTFDYYIGLHRLVFVHCIEDIILIRWYPFSFVASLTYSPNWPLIPSLKRLRIRYTSTYWRASQILGSAVHKWFQRLRVWFFFQPSLIYFHQNPCFPPIPFCFPSSSQMIKGSYNHLGLYCWIYSWTIFPH